jgi:hypothetical protein
VATVAVDFDGVIHRYGRGWGDGTIYDEPVEGAFEALRALMAKHAVFVFTTREREPVAAWLRARGGFETTTRVPAKYWNQRGVLLVTDRKLPAIAYVDDRAVRFHDWEQAMADIATFERKD